MSQRRRQLGEGVKTVTGIIVHILVYEGGDMAAFSPADNTEHAAVTIFIHLHLKYSAFFLWRSCRWQLFSSGCSRQDRAPRHSLVRVETAEGRKRNARKVQKCRAVLKSRLVVTPSPSPSPSLTLLRFDRGQKLTVAVLGLD